VAEVTEIVLVRTGSAPISEADKEAARRVLFDQIDGLSEAHKKSWRRIWNWFLNKAEPGEMLSLKTHRDRLGWYHRKHMAMEQKVFEAQERFEHFKQFRDWLKLGAGHCDWYPGPKGGVVPIPKSIDYASVGQDEMEQFHEAAVTFLRTPHAIKTLWPKLPEHQRELAVEAVLIPFEEVGR
jgi:hypothetical protein